MSNETPGLARLSMSLPADLFRQLDMMAVSYTHLTLPTKRIV